MREQSPRFSTRSDKFSFQEVGIFVESTHVLHYRRSAVEGTKEGFSKRAGDTRSTWQDDGRDRAYMRRKDRTEHCSENNIGKCAAVTYSSCKLFAVSLSLSHSHPLSYSLSFSLSSLSSSPFLFPFIYLSLFLSLIGNLSFVPSASRLCAI